MDLNAYTRLHLNQHAEGVYFSSCFRLGKIGIFKPGPQSTTMPLW